MDQKTTSDQQEPGIYVRGIPVSNEATMGNRKDGTTWVRVRNELALQPGLAVFEQYFDPAKDNAIKVINEEVREYPRLEEFKPVTLKVLRYKTYNEQFIIQDARPV